MERRMRNRRCTGLLLMLQKPVVYKWGFRRLCGRRCKEQPQRPRPTTAAYRELLAATQAGENLVLSPTGGLNEMPHTFATNKC